MGWNVVPREWVAPLLPLLALAPLLPAARRPRAVAVPYRSQPRAVSPDSIAPHSRTAPYTTRQGACKGAGICRIIPPLLPAVPGPAAIAERQGRAWRYGAREQYLGGGAWRTFDDARAVIYESHRWGLWAAAWRGLRGRGPPKRLERCSKAAFGMRVSGAGAGQGGSRACFGARRVPALRRP